MMSLVKSPRLRWRVPLVIASIGSLMALVACTSSSTESSRPATGVTPVTQQATADLSSIPDGKPLFDFLLANVPELVEKVPCSCCPFALAECYRGACPTTCGPCNRIGRKAYEWHKQGMSDDAIVARVKAEFPRRAGH